jgi:hypothetical protein
VFQQQIWRRFLDSLNCAVVLALHSQKLVVPDVCAILATPWPAHQEMSLRCAGENLEAMEASLGLFRIGHLAWSVKEDCRINFLHRREDRSSLVTESARRTRDAPGTSRDGLRSRELSPLCSVRTVGLACCIADPDHRLTFKNTL